MHSKVAAKLHRAKLEFMNDVAWRFDLGRFILHKYVHCILQQDDTDSKGRTAACPRVEHVGHANLDTWHCQAAVFFF